MKVISRAPLIILMLVALAPVRASAQSIGTLEEIVRRADFTVKDFTADPNMAGFRDYIRRAKAIIIVPRMVKAGFILGGSGGNGVLLARSAKTGRWSYPAFYKMGSVTFGLQAGGEVSQVVLLIMTRRGLDAMLSTEAKLGVDASVAVGPVGAGIKGQTADVVAFARTKGLYGGINVEGAVIGIEDGWNRTYYRKYVRPVDILIRRNVRNRQADRLRVSVSRVARGRR